MKYISNLSLVFAAVCCGLQSQAQPPAFDHVVVVIEENHSFGDIIGSSAAPNINALAASSANIVNASTDPQAKLNPAARSAAPRFGVVNGGGEENGHWNVLSTIEDIYGLTHIGGSMNRRPNFEVVINFTTPFYYNPAKGNLLLDVHNAQGSVEAPPNDQELDGTSASGDSVSRVYNYGDVTAAAAVWMKETVTD